MLTMAIRTDGNVLDALDVILAVDAFQIVPLNADMASAAGLYDILAGDEGERVSDPLNIVGAVAVAAVGRHRQPGFLQGLEMSALVISADEPGAFLGGDFLEVALLAGRRKVNGEGRRIEIILGPDVVGSVAVLTSDGDSGRPLFVGCLMDAALELLHGRFMAVATGGRLEG